jgi:hypothetical protein
MSTLLDTQRAMLRALVFRDHEDVASQIVGDELSAAERLDVYRNTFLSSLTSALRISYPAVHRLVGEEFFEGATQCFIEADPPQGAYLNAYGAGFGDFLEQFSPAASLSYLADVARLEWAVNCALHAQEATPLNQEGLAALANSPADRLVLIPHPSVSQLRLDHTAEVIWRAVLAEDDQGLSKIDTVTGPEWLRIERTTNGVEVSRIDEDEWRFTAALCGGETLKVALDIALDADMVSILARHLAAGRFIGFRLSDSILSANSENAL